MGAGLALRRAVYVSAVLIAALLLAGCGSEKSEPSPMGAAIGTIAKATVGRVLPRGKAEAKAATPKPVTRADIEKFGIPILRAVIPARGADALLTQTDTKGGVVTWATTDGASFTLRNGVLIQTRGLGPDLMSSQAPSPGQILATGGSHERIYFFLGEDDQPTRRTYTCTTKAEGRETIEIFGRSHSVTKVTEECARPQGSISNTYWFEGSTIRKSRQLASGGLGFIEFERVVD
jgi:hypothetical protein